MKLPDDMFKQEMLTYLTVDDIVNLDNSCMNRKYRPHLLEKISDVTLLGDEDKSMKLSLFEWLRIRRIYLINMMLHFEDDINFTSTIEKEYLDQFRYTQHLVMRGPIRDDTTILIISSCPCLLSIDISRTDNDEFSFYPQITDHTLQLIAENCTGLLSLSLRDCVITNNGLIIISEHCPNLKSMQIIGRSITDAVIISISIHCIGLQSLNLDCCRKITDASIISISIYCTGLRSLNLEGCAKITDTSIISISTQCTGLQLLHLDGNHSITDASIISISSHCT
jgi:hypothetical protein